MMRKMSWRSSRSSSSSSSRSSQRGSRNVVVPEAVVVAESGISTVWSRSTSSDAAAAAAAGGDDEQEVLGVAVVGAAAAATTTTMSSSVITGKLVQGLEETLLACLAVQERLRKEKRVPKINGEQADYLKQRLLWMKKPAMLELYSGIVPFLRDQAAAAASGSRSSSSSSRSSSSSSGSFRVSDFRVSDEERRDHGQQQQRLLHHALLFSANTLWELGRVMHRGEALVVDCFGSPTKEWQQLVILQSILAARGSSQRLQVSRVSAAADHHHHHHHAEPLWSPFYLVLRDLHYALGLVEKAYTELNEICGYIFNSIPPPDGAQDQYRLEKDKELCHVRAVKDTDILFEECRQIVHANRRNSDKLCCAKYILGKIENLRNRSHQEAAAAGGAGQLQGNHLPQFLLIDNQSLAGNAEPFAVGASGYVADREWLKIPVAVKTLKSGEVPNTMFDEEVALLARVEHPHVVRLLGYCCICREQESTRNRVVMEKVKQDLRKLMDDIMESIMVDDDSEDVNHHQVPFPALVALDIIMQLAEALKFLRIQRVMHRDVKAMNILVNIHPVPLQSITSTRAHQQDASANLQYYHIKLTDLGAAQYKPPNNSWSSTTMKGTTNWRAPEVFRDENAAHYSWAADVYSFAMACYEILSGKMPFEQRPVTHARLRDGERPSLPLNCQPELAALVRRCWETQPSARPSIFQVCEELRSCKEALLRRYCTTSLTPAPEAAITRSTPP